MDEPKTDKASLKNLVITMIVVSLIAGGFVLTVSFLQRKILIKTETKIVEVTLRPPGCPQSFEEFQKLVEAGKSVKLIPTNLNSYGVNGQFVNPKHVVLQRSGTSELACGYLYVRAKIGGKPLHDVYDSI